MTLCRHPVHPDSTRFSAWHPSGLHIDSDSSVRQQTIDALLVLADMCVSRVDQGD
jgi:hypothetical protein